MKRQSREPDSSINMKKKDVTSFTVSDRDILEINRKTASGFVKKSRSFLNLPRSLFECDVQQCNPDLYKGKRGKAAVERARKALTLAKKADRILEQLCTLLES